MAARLLPSGRKRLWCAPEAAIPPAGSPTRPRPAATPSRCIKMHQFTGAGNLLKRPACAAPKPCRSVHQNRHEKRAGEAGVKACFKGWQVRRHWSDGRLPLSWYEKRYHPINRIDDFLLWKWQASRLINDPEKRLRKQRHGRADEDYAGRCHVGRQPNAGGAAQYSARPSAHRHPDRLLVDRLPLWTPRVTQVVFGGGHVVGCCHLSGL